MKTLFISLLAALPAAAVVESVRLQWTGPKRSARKSGAIIADRKSSSALAQDDVRGHHRYYGRSAYP